MARLPRIVVPNLPHHVTQRGNRRQQTFFCSSDYQYYLDVLSRTCKSYSVKILAYCLMPNHIHLILQPGCEKSLALAVSETHCAYTRMINFKKGWQGHLWQGRFFSVPMDDEYFIKCVQYIELNPVRANICKDPIDYKWSSGRSHLGSQEDTIISVDHLLEMAPDWKSFLYQPIRADEFDILRKISRTGRPVGTMDFLENIESVTGKSVIFKKELRGH
jgi:putative transposase